MRGFEGVQALVDEYKWAIDIELCVFPQEGLTNNPGTDELLVEGLKRGAKVIGAAPNYDTDHAGADPPRVRTGARVRRRHRHASRLRQLRRSDSTSVLVCELTEQYKCGGRVAIGHATKLSTLDPPEQKEMARSASPTPASR